jgi:hypothetical protein
MTVRTFHYRDGGFGWQLFQGADSVGTSENPSKSHENAVAVAHRWARKYGYGKVVAARHLGDPKPADR